MTDRQIRIIPSFTGVRPDVICFETQASPEEVADLTLYAFEHHGGAYTPFSPGSLRLFHERVLMGQDMPATMVLTRWYRYDQLLAAAMFVQPDIVLEPSCSNLVNSFDLVDRLGPPAFGHVPYDHKELAYMLRNLTEPFVGSQEGTEKALSVLQQAVGLIVAYITEGTLPPVTLPQPQYEVMEAHGPFVAFESEDYVWDEFYREGYLCGVWFRGGETLVSRKSALTPYLEPGQVLRLLEEHDTEGTWRIEHGTLVGEAGIDRPTLIAALRSLLP